MTTWLDGLGARLQRLLGGPCDRHGCGRLRGRVPKGGPHRRPAAGVGNRRLAVTEQVAPSYAAVPFTLGHRVW